MCAKGSLDILCHIATSHTLVILSLSRPEAAVRPAKEGRRRLSAVLFLKLRHPQRLKRLSLQPSQHTAAGRWWWWWQQ